MGKTHLSGLEIGDPSTGIYAAVPQVAKLRFAALGQGQQLHFPDGALITEVRVIAVNGALVAGTVSIGTTLHGTEVFTGAATAGAPLAVEKMAAAGKVWVELTAGTVPLYVFIGYIPG